MEICADDIWMSVDVYGPQVEIDRLQELCAIIDIDGETEEAVVDFSALMPNSQLGGEYYTWAAVSNVPRRPYTLSFAFDTGGWFPEEIFECLVEEFPDLAFFCSAVGSLREFIAHGWYNGPPGAPKLAGREMPGEEWDPIDMSISDDAEWEAHKSIVDSLISAARAQDR